MPYVSRNIIAQPKTQIQNTKQEQPKKQEKIDWFAINTGLKGENKELFINYIRDIAENARKRHNGDFNKINHAVANAIAYPRYHNDVLQAKVNDFGGKPNSKYYEEIQKKLLDIHENKEEIFPIDLPHLAAPLASAEKSSWYKEYLKLLLGKPLFIKDDLKNLTPKDIFFQHNSLVGDMLTYIDKRDEDTDKDAFILYYHPDYKDIELHERIIKYYNSGNLEDKREGLYKEAMKEFTVKTGIEEEKLRNYSFSTLGAFGLLLFGVVRIKSKREMLKQVLKQLKQGVKKILYKKLASGTSKVIKAKNYIVESMKIAKRAIGTIAKRTATTIINKAKSAVTKVAKSAYNNIIKPVYNKVAKPIYNNIIKPVYNKVVKPIYNNVIKPVYNKVVKPIYNNVIKPVYNKVVKPIYNNVIKPLYKKISNPVVNVFKTGWNSVKSKTSSIVTKAKNFLGRWF